MKAASSYTCHFAENADEMVQILVAAGANVNLQDEAGRTALIHAVTWPYHGVALQAIQALIEAGSDLNTRDDEGNTALTYAQNRHYLHIDYSKVVEQLKANGAFE